LEACNLAPHPSNLIHHHRSSIQKLTFWAKGGEILEVTWSVGIRRCRHLRGRGTPPSMPVGEPGGLGLQLEVGVSWDVILRFKGGIPQWLVKVNHVAHEMAS